MSLSNICDKGEREIFVVRERKLIVKVSVANNLSQRKIVRGNQALQFSKNVIIIIMMIAEPNR